MGYHFWWSWIQLFPVPLSENVHNDLVCIALVSIPVAGCRAFAIYNNHTTLSASQHGMDLVRFNALTCDLGA